MQVLLTSFQVYLPLTGHTCICPNLGDVAIFITSFWHVCMHVCQFFVSCSFQLKELIYRSHQLGMIFNITEKPINNLDIAECFEQYFLSFAPLYRIIFLLCSIAALATKGYFYCGCILYVLMGSEVLLNILTAVRRSGMNIVLLIKIFAI